MDDFWLKVLPVLALIIAANAGSFIKKRKQRAAKNATPPPIYTREEEELEDENEDEEWEESATAGGRSILETLEETYRKGRADGSIPTPWRVPGGMHGRHPSERPASYASAPPPKPVEPMRAPTPMVESLPEEGVRQTPLAEEEKWASPTPRAGDPLIPRSLNDWRRAIIAQEVLRPRWAARPRYRRPNGTTTER